jgi:hypothetical protein
LGRAHADRSVGFLDTSAAEADIADAMRKYIQIKRLALHPESSTARF